MLSNLALAQGAALAALLLAAIYGVVMSVRYGRKLSALDKDVGKLDREAEDRYQECGELAEAFQGVLHELAEVLQDAALLKKAVSGQEKLLAVDADELEVVRTSAYGAIEQLQGDVREIVDEVKALNSALENVRKEPARPPVVVDVSSKALQPPTGPHRLNVVQPSEEAPKKCKGCKHFNKEIWEDTLRMNPAFSSAASWITPNQMGAPAERDEEGDLLPAEGPLPLEADKWSNFAVCVKKDSPNYSKGLSGEDTCEKWEWEQAS